MKPFVISILNSLSDFFAMILIAPKPKPSNEQTIIDYRMYVFEAAGLLVGIEDLEAEAQRSALVTLLQTAVHQVRPSAPAPSP